MDLYEENSSYIIKFLLPKWRNFFFSRRPLALYVTKCFLNRFDLVFFSILCIHFTVYGKDCIIISFSRQFLKRNKISLNWSFRRLIYNFFISPNDKDKRNNLQWHQIFFSQNRHVSISKSFQSNLFHFLSTPIFLYFFLLFFPSHFVYRRD